MAAAMNDSDALEAARDAVKHALHNGLLCQVFPAVDFWTIENGALVRILESLLPGYNWRKCIGGGNALVRLEKTREAMAKLADDCLQSVEFPACPEVCKRLQVILEASRDAD